MGEVYRARDTKLNRTVALKKVIAEPSDNPEKLRRLLREARLASAINHSNVAHIYEIVETPENTMIAMEYVEGKSLSVHIQEHSLTLQRILQIGAQIADGLQEAHSLGIVHRDIKPSNILITQKGAVKILDFGLAKLTQDVSEEQQSEEITFSQTEPGRILGTWPYMSPEQVLGRSIDARSDIFSLGTVLYQMATSKLPFTGENPRETFDRILHSTPVPPVRLNNAIPIQLETIILKCMEKEPDRRYQSANELMIDLQNLNRSLHQISPSYEISTKRSRNAPAIWAIALMVLLLSAGVYWFYRSSRTTSEMQSIAVLPFVNESGNPEAEYLSDGITESLINKLSELSKLRVIARTSVFRFKNQNKDPIQIGKDLKVDSLLTGKVVQNEKRLIIQADLLEVATGSQLWGERYNREMSEVLHIQEEISRNIADKMKIKLTGQDEMQLAKSHTKIPDAYDDYLRGRFYRNKRTPEAIQKSIEYFQKAIQIDPSYAQAYAGLAETYSHASNLGGRLDRKSAIAKAEDAIRKALELDPDLPEAQTAIGLKYLEHDWNFRAAGNAFRRAIELNPNSSDAHHQISHYYMDLGRLEDSLNHSRLAIEIDPMDITLHAHLALHYIYAREFNKAIDQAKKTIEIDPTYIQGYAFLAYAYLFTKNYKDSISQFQKALALSPRVDLKAELAATYARMGEKEKALEILREVENETGDDSTPSVELALVYESLGAKNRAFELLEKGYREKDPNLVTLKTAPWLDSLRDDVRYQELIRKVFGSESQ